MAKIKGGEKVPGKDETDVEVDINREKKKYRDKIDEYDQANKPLRQKVFESVKESGNAVRAFITAYDMSAVLRQGAMLTAAHPLKALPALGEMIGHGVSSRAFEKAQLNLRKRPNAALYEQAGLYLADHLGKPNAQEEAFIGKWIKKIPGVAASERMYTSYLNRMRADVFDSLAAGLPRDGKPSLEEAKALANYVNKATGRGTLPGQWDKIMTPMAQLFFSPRYAASRFQVLGGQPFFGGTMRTRGKIAGEYARALGGLAAFYAISKALIPDSRSRSIRDRPTSARSRSATSDSTRSPASAQTAVFLTRLVEGETKIDEHRQGDRPEQPEV